MSEYFWVLTNSGAGPPWKVCRSEYSLWLVTFLLFGVQKMNQHLTFSIALHSSWWIINGLQCEHHTWILMCVFLLLASSLCDILISILTIDMSTIFRLWTDSHYLSDFHSSSAVYFIRCMLCDILFFADGNEIHTPTTGKGAFAWRCYSAGRFAVLQPSYSIE